ncbi:MAG: tetratricopeptide repeat protein [Flavobacterium sp.]
MAGGTSASALGQRNKYEQDFIENKAKQVALSDKSLEYKQVFSKRLSEIGFNPIKIKQVMNDAEEGKKLIQKNTPSPYQQPGLPVDANKQNYDLGRGYLLTGDNDKAIQHFTESLSNLPESEMQKPERQVMQSGDESVMYSGATQFPAEKNPANALSSIGLAYQNKGDIANAQNFYIQAISHDEGNANALLGLADTYKKQGDINESNDLINRAAQSYKKQALATQIEADKQDDTRKQHEADYMNTIADGLEKFIQSDPNGDLGVLGKLTPWGFVYHNVKEMGLGALQGAKNIVEGAEKSMYVPGQKLDATGGAAQELAGAGELYMSLNPEIAIFNSIIQPINEAAQANPENKALNYTSKAISSVFAPAHTIADLLNMKPEEGSTADFLLQSGDVIGFILGAKGFEKIKDAKSSISTLKDLAKEAEQTKDLQKQEEIKAQAKAITDGINSITVDELQQTAKQLGKDKVVEAIDKMTTEKESAAGSDLHEKANQLKNDLANPELTDLHPDIAQNLETVNNEIAKQEITNAEKTSIDAEKQSELEGLNKQLLDETITPATKEIINNKIKQLNQEGYAIQKPSTERNVPLPGATGETITEGGEGVRQGIKGDETAKEGEEKVEAGSGVVDKPMMDDIELSKVVGNNDVVKQIKKAEEQLGEGVVDRNRLIETAKKIQEVDKKDKLLPEHIFEALQYETGYPDNWQDLRNAIKKGGIDINSEAVQRQIEVGVDLPKDIVEEFKKSERYKNATPELVKAVEQSLKETPKAEAPKVAEKVIAQTEELEELDFLKLKDDNGTATESEKNRIIELEQKINPAEAVSEQTAPPLLKQAWNGGLELAAKAIEAGGTVTEAIAKAIEHFKNSDYYKSLSESGKKRLVEHLEETLDANKSKEHKLFDRIDELSKELSNKDRAEIQKIYYENPKVKEINRNFKKIISQLEGTEEFKKSDGCP